jgi:hypothetical protein
MVVFLVPQMARNFDGAAAPITRYSMDIRFLVFKKTAADG